jgi:MFS family permease
VSSPFLSGLANDTVTPEARRALVGAALGYAMDGFDLLILGFLLGPIAEQMHLVPAQVSSLLTFTLVGAVIGGVAFGTLSDHLGRVRVLTWTIVLFAIFTGLCALAQSYEQLIVFRTIAGLGLGGEFGIGMTLVAEVWPASKRARVSAYVGLGWQTGVLAAALVTPALLPHIGWRGMFAVGVFPALVAFLIRRRLHEPELFKRRHSTNQAQSLRGLVADAATVRISVGMIILCSVQNFGYYGVMIWLPNYLNANLHFGLTRTAAWTGATILGMGVGIWAFGVLADRFGRRPSFFAYMLGAAIMVVVYARLSTPGALLIGGAVMGFFVNGMLGGYGALMSELYPTAARATAQNVLFNIGRLVGGFGPVVVGTIAAKHGFPTAVSLLSLIYIIDLVAMLALIPERRGTVLT